MSDRWVFASPAPAPASEVERAQRALVDARRMAARSAVEHAHRVERAQRRLDAALREAAQAGDSSGGSSGHGVER